MCFLRRTGRREGAGKVTSEFYQQKSTHFTQHVYP